MSVLERRVRELGARWSGKRVRRVDLGVRLSRTGRSTVVVVCWSMLTDIRSLYCVQQQWDYVRRYVRYAILLTDDI